MNKKYDNNKGSEIQAILFNKDTPIDDIVDFLYKHNIIPLKAIHETQGYKRVRINDPKKYKNMRIKEINDKIKFILGFK